MKVFLLAALLALTPSQAVQNGADIEGRVLRAGSLDPIPNVQVSLAKANSSSSTPNADAAAALESLQTLLANNPGLPQATIDSLISSREQGLGLAPGTLVLSGQNSALTDAKGHFVFKDQPPGKYTVRAVLDGYFGASTNGFPAANATKAVTVESQKAVPATDILMSKGGVISGHIRDPKGQPAIGVTVSANRVTYANGRPQWAAAISRPSDDRGEFRLFWVSPGEYFIGITPRAATAVPGLQDSWARTFFPGVMDALSATPLTMKDGGELAGIDFTIQSLAATGSFKISGRAINPLAVPNPTTGVVDRSLSSFVLSPRDPGVLDSINPPAFSNAVPVAARPNGEFEIANVRPGSYDLIPYVMASLPQAPAPTAAAAGAPPTPPAIPPNRRYNIDRARVDIRNSDVDGVALEIQRGTEIRGKVISQGRTSLATDKIKINFHSMDTIPEAFATISGAISVDSNGSFSATDMPKASYSLQITGLPETAYVADIRQGENTIFDTGLTAISRSVTPIEIVVNSNGATIEGKVQTADQKPFANATVVVVPPARHRQNVMMYKTVQSDDKGAFSIKGVPPGDYTVFAWESIPPTAWMNSEYLAKYQNRGRLIVATQDKRLEVQLELIPDNYTLR